MQPNLLQRIFRTHSCIHSWHSFTLIILLALDIPLLPNTLNVIPIHAICGLSLSPYMSKFFKCIFLPLPHFSVPMHVTPHTSLKQLISTALSPFSCPGAMFFLYNNVRPTAPSNNFILLHSFQQSTTKNFSHSTSTSFFQNLISIHSSFNTSMQTQSYFKL